MIWTKNCCYVNFYLLFISVFVSVVFCCCFSSCCIVQCMNTECKPCRLTCQDDFKNSYVSSCVLSNLFSLLTHSLIKWEKIVFSLFQSEQMTKIKGLLNQGMINDITSRLSRIESEWSHLKRKCVIFMLKYFLIMA